MPDYFTIGPQRHDDLLTPAVLLPLVDLVGDEVGWIAFKHIPCRGLERVQVIGIWVAPSLQRRGIGRRLVAEVLSINHCGSVLVDPTAYTSAGDQFWPRMIREGYAEPI